MRFLHTSDWHLGRTLHGVDLLEAQRAVLGELVGLVASPADGVAVDAVLLAGDVYDRAVPPVEAVALLHEVLAALVEHTTVIVTGGNHDSAIRLGFGSQLFADRLHIRTSLEAVGVPVLLGDVAVYPLPYLDPDTARHVLAACDEPLARSHQAVTSAAMQLVRDDLAQRPEGTRSIVMAHAFVIGGAASDSERSIEVGGVDHVTTDVFAGVDYVALGHLHGAQSAKSASSTVLHYSGSPLRYSFSEMAQRKSVTVVDINGSGGVALHAVALTQPRAMAAINGELADLLDDVAFEPHVGSWLRVTVTDRSRPDDLYTRVKSRFPHALQILHEPAGAAAVGQIRRSTSVDVTPAELAGDFVRHVTGVDASEAEIALFEAAYETAAREGAA